MANGTRALPAYVFHPDGAAPSGARDTDVAADVAGRGVAEAPARVAVACGMGVAVRAGEAVGADVAVGGIGVSVGSGVAVGAWAVASCASSAVRVLVAAAFTVAVGATVGIVTLFPPQPVIRMQTIARAQSEDNPFRIPPPFTNDTPPFVKREIEGNVMRV